MLFARKSRDDSKQRHSLTDAWKTWKTAGATLVSKDYIDNGYCFWLVPAEFCKDMDRLPYRPSSK